MDILILMDCVEREIHRRETDYPYLVAKGLLPIKEAESELEQMRAVHITLGSLAGFDTASDNKLYNACMGEYRKFHVVQVGVAPNLNGKLAKTSSDAMRNIIKYLLENSKGKDPEGVLRAWCYVLQNWAKVSDFYKKQVALPDIQRNLANILFDLRNGHNKKSADSNALDEHSRSLAERRQAAASKHNQQS